MGLAENIRRFVKPENKVEMGFNARKFYEENFKEKMFMDKLESRL